MGLPTVEDNQEGYFNYSDVTRKVEGIRGKKYMLIHGTGDDNVHYQQSMALAKVLEEKDIMFEQQSYPDQAHDLASVTPHLYHTIDRFLGKCLGYSSNRKRWIKNDSSWSSRTSSMRILRGLIRVPVTERPLFSMNLIFQTSVRVVRLFRTSLNS